MTIKNYTFLSQNGTEFPISATADRRLYLMLGGMDYSNYKMKHWVAPINSGLNRIYSDTSFILGGAYFEFSDNAVTLNPNATNFIHVNIDLSNTSSPVFISVETKDNSNSADMNTTSSVLKKCIEVVVTNAISILSVVEKNQDSELVKQLKLAMNPVGTILTTTNSANPTSYIGGVWERYGKGQVLVGVDENDADFNEIGKTGGEKTHALTAAENGPHSHSYTRTGNNNYVRVEPSSTYGTSLAGTTNTGSSGEGAPHNNLQPYVAVYMFRRTA